MPPGDLQPALGAPLCLPFCRVVAEADTPLPRGLSSKGKQALELCPGLPSACEEPVPARTTARRTNRSDLLLLARALWHKRPLAEARAEVYCIKMPVGTMWLGCCCFLSMRVFEMHMGERTGFLVAPRSRISFPERVAHVAGRDVESLASLRKISAVLCSRNGKVSALLATEKTRETSYFVYLKMHASLPSPWGTFISRHLFSSTFTLFVLLLPGTLVTPCDRWQIWTACSK